jgi:hypothetical protein
MGCITRSMPLDSVSIVVSQSHSTVVRDMETFLFHHDPWLVDNAIPAYSQYTVS